MSCSENEALWREVASLRQKHAQQQKVVNKVRGRPAGGPGGLGGQADRASRPTAHPVPHLAGAVQPDPGGEEKDVRRWGSRPSAQGPAPPLPPGAAGPAEAANATLPRSPLMLNDGSSAHPLPKYGRQYSLEHSHGASPYPVSAWPAAGRGAAGAAAVRDAPPLGSPPFDGRLRPRPSAAPASTPQMLFPAPDPSSPTSPSWCPAAPWPPQAGA